MWPFKKPNHPADSPKYVVMQVTTRTERWFEIHRFYNTFIGYVFYSTDVYKCLPDAIEVINEIIETEKQPKVAEITRKIVYPL